MYHENQNAKGYFGLKPRNHLGTQNPDLEGFFNQNPDLEGYATRWVAVHVELTHTATDMRR